jgi:hypothetical protein
MTHPDIQTHGSVWLPRYQSSDTPLVLPPLSSLRLALSSPLLTNPRLTVACIDLRLRIEF